MLLNIQVNMTRRQYIMGYTSMDFREGIRAKDV